MLQLHFLGAPSQWPSHIVRPSADQIIPCRHRIRDRNDEQLERGQ